MFQVCLTSRLYQIRKPSSSTRDTLAFTSLRQSRSTALYHIARENSNPYVAILNFRYRLQDPHELVSWVNKMEQREQAAHPIPAPSPTSGEGAGERGNGARLCLAQSPSPMGQAHGGRAAGRITRRATPCALLHVLQRFCIPVMSLADMHLTCPAVCLDSHAPAFGPDRHQRCPPSSSQAESPQARPD